MKCTTMIVGFAIVVCKLRERGEGFAGVRLKWEGVFSVVRSGESVKWVINGELRGFILIKTL